MRPDFTFARFFPTSGCAEALEVARSFAASSPGAPQLLLLHGPPGVGKTHLLHAIVHAVRAENASIRVACTTAVGLTERLLDAIRSDTVSDFRRLSGPADVLVIDDLHVLARKPATQAEFGLTLNAWLQSGLRIACAAGCRPGRIRALTGPLRALSSALLVAMRRPTSRGMRRILLSMANAPESKWPAEMLDTVIGQCGSDVRTAIGMMTRLRFEQSVRSGAFR